MALSIKQTKFVECYLASNNARQSAINAGYPEKNSASMGWQLLKSPKILEKLNQSRTQIRSSITKESYIDKALETFEKLDITEPNSPRFYDLAGKALGYINNNQDQRPNQSLTINVSSDQLSSGQSNVWENTRKLLGI